MTREKRPPRYVWVELDNGTVRNAINYYAAAGTADGWHRYRLDDPKPKRKAKR